MSEALTSFTGWELRAKADGAEVLAALAASTPISPATVRYELLAVAGRGFHPPRVVVTSELSEEDSAAPDDELEQASTDYEGLRLSWSLLYRFVAQTAPPVVAPFAIYLLGVNPPPEVSEEELAVFNDFYTNVHLVEVAEQRGALRALRYELVREVRPVYSGAPRFLALYEVDEHGAASRRHVGPPYSAGPEVWQRHTTPWRLWYRRLGNEAATDPPR